MSTSPYVGRPSARNSLATPTPRDMEARSLFNSRFGAADVVRSKWPTPVKRMLAAERAWAAAKRESLVSISTSEDQFLLFGPL